jgi:hypothetical protein
VHCLIGLLGRWARSGSRLLASGVCEPGPPGVPTGCMSNLSSAVLLRCVWGRAMRSRLQSGARTRARAPSRRRCRHVALRPGYELPPSVQAPPQQHNSVEAAHARNGRACTCTCTADVRQGPLGRRARTVRTAPKARAPRRALARWRVGRRMYARPPAPPRNLPTRFPIHSFNHLCYALVVPGLLSGKAVGGAAACW